MRPVPVPCLLLTTALVLGCAKGTPKPPPNVPAAALFAGEPGKGHFIHFESITQLGWMVKIYDEKTGAVVHAGEFRVMGLARAEVRPEELVGFDGQFIHLKDGTRLVPWKK